ncbi:MAG TPA: globin domain-containing protein [Pseudonocardiaceae bacterium]|nr:globin domain-containing protein [Pseudonocardiaceae bacterium]
MDIARLKASWEAAAEHGVQLPLFFYSTLFLDHPPVREMFPPVMAGQRDKLVAALGNVVSNIDQLDSVVPMVQQLGRDHRKFGVITEHYPAVGQALLATLEYFLGDQWTPELAADWAEAYGIVATVMQDAAKVAAQTQPPWWEAEIVAHERRTLNIAVLTLRTNPRMDYLPGQSVAVQSDVRPQMWRYYSPANSPRSDDTMELHVRLVDGGAVSSALVQAVGVGDILRLGAPIGRDLVVDHDRDLVLIAGGTGLAPFKSLVDHAANEQSRRRIRLYVGVRTRRDFYDMTALRDYARRLPGLRVVPVTSEDPGFSGDRGRVADVALQHGTWPNEEIYLCGSPEMVTNSLAALRSAGVPDERIHHEEFAGTSAPPARQAPPRTRQEQARV